MCALNVRLQRDEEVVFETERAVLTSRRLLVNLDRKNRESVTDEISLGNVTNFKKDTRGEESQYKLGFKAVGVSLLLVLIQTLAPDLPFLLGITLFLATAAGIIVGLYLLINRGLLRVKPSTSVLFTVVGSRDVPVYFPGRDNPDADELTKLYVRAKRDLSLS